MGIVVTPRWQMSDSEIEAYVLERMREGLVAPGVVEAVRVDSYPGERIVSVTVAPAHRARAIELAQTIRCSLEHQFPSVGVRVAP